MNPMEMLKTAEIKLVFRLPGKLNFQEVPMVIEVDAVPGIAPLSRNHDVPFMPKEHAMARQQIEERERIASHLGRVFAAKILEELKKQDPVNGYSPEENDKFYRR